MKTRLFAALLLCVSIVHAQHSAETALDRLAKVGQFAFGGTGYAGVISQGEKDYKVVMSRPSAESDFERLLLVGNQQAKAYALVGIRTLDPARFKQLSASLANSKEEVVTQQGCIVDHEAPSTVLTRIASGRYSIYNGSHNRHWF